jgi:LDH2 family malate/lactate/ureidoglycolate dehydrogenase
MSEVHRYKVVKMLSEVGNRINYAPHGPEVVIASDYDALLDERDQLKAKLAELISAVRSINHGPSHKVVVPGDDEPQYRQRKEWIEWILELCDTAMPADKKTGD